jgi:nucleoside-diphosphate-sugar epimerase/pimeloyl-ACP methyl ester carboxylesterase
MKRFDTFVTGGTGLLGRWLVPELTRLGRTVGVLARDAERRQSEYSAWVTAHGGRADRVELLSGDLAAPDLGMSAEARAIAQRAVDVFHLGAAMTFGLDPEAAREINERGTERVLALAAAAPALRRFVLVSGFRIGYAPADGDEAALTRLGAYEASKIRADRRAHTIARERGIPLSVVHPATVIGDARSGETTLFWGFSDLVRDLYAGKLPLLPGGPHHWMPLVTVDYVARFMARLPEHAPSSGEEYTLLDETTPSLSELAERIARHVGVSPPTRFVPKAIARRLMPAMGQSAEALSFISEDRYDVASANRAARAMGLTKPDLDSALKRNIDFLMATRFGKTRPAESAAMDRVGGAPTFVSGDRARADFVMLHGLPLDSGSWDEVASGLGGTSLRADLPGFGRSAPGAAAPSDWVASLLRDQESPPMMIGHSLGTRYAIEYAARFPERVRGLVLIAPYFLQSPARWVYRNTLTARALFAMMRRPDLDRAVGDAAKRRPEWVDGLYASLVRPGARARLARSLAANYRVRASLAALLRGLDVPVLIIAGDRDPLTVDPGHRSVVVIPGAGHNVHLDAPDAVVAAIRAFAARDRAPKAA